ncbi:MAG: hypothetical protein WD688_21105 [Candidatus Binatia bacterium]
MTTDVASPFSTGGGGPFFEAKVQASFLLYLLIGGRVPCLPSGTAQSIRFQGKQAGYATDDLIVAILSPHGQQHRLLAQVKHHVVITKSDAEFRAALQDAWADFNNENVFTQGRDVLALITGPMSDRAIQHVRPLLDWARTSANSPEFLEKVNTAQFSSDQKRNYLKVFREVLTEIARGPVTDENLWIFLKHLYLFSYDFDVQGSKDEASVLTVLEMARNQATDLDSEAVWEGLIRQAQEWNQTGGTFTTLQLPERLKGAVQGQRSVAQSDAVKRLHEHFELILDTISTELAPGLHLPRTGAVDELINAVESSGVVIVRGAAGWGKSAVVKMLLTKLEPAIISFGFKAQEFNHAHVHQFLTSIGIGLTVEQLKAEFSLLPRKLLLIDGAEKLFELNSLDAFRQLIRQLSDDPSWTIVITCRESAAEELREHLLGQWRTEAIMLQSPPLTSAELAWIAGQAPQLAPLLENLKLEKFFRNLFILSLAWKAFPSTVPDEIARSIDEREFKDIVWRGYVERVSQKQGGMPLKRRNALLRISQERAKRMSLSVSADGCDPEAVQALVDDGILIESKVGGYAPAHDVLEDWAVSRFIGLEFEATGGEALKFLRAVGTEPAMRRGFRLWLSQALAEPENQAVMDFVLSAFHQDDIPPVWRDEIAISVLQSENAGEFFRRVERLLLADGKVLYRRLIQVLRTACKGPNESLLQMYGLDAYRSHVVLGSVFVVPVGTGWPELIKFTYRNLESFDLSDTATVLGLLKDWAQPIGPTVGFPNEAAAAAQIALKYWRLLTEPDVYASGQDQEFLNILFKIPQAARGDVEELIRSALANRRIRDYPSRTIREHVAKSMECQALCEYFPELVIEVARDSWRFGPFDEDEFNSRRELEQSFGLTRHVQFDYIPPSSLQGPFAFLLAYHPVLAIEFIVRLLNECAEIYANSEFGDEVVKIEIPDESGAKTVIGSARLWHMYRGMAAAPAVLECGLMALEGWLLEQARQKNDIRKLFSDIFEMSQSVATIAVLASVAVAYPEAIGDGVLKILESRELYQWDLARSYQERSNVPDLAAALGIPTQAIDRIYDSERKRSAELPHRKSNLEELAFRLQLTPRRDKIWPILDRFLSSLAPQEEQTEADKTWRIALHRMDARHIKAEEGQEPGQVILISSEAPSDLQNFINEGAERRELFNRRMRLANWGMTHFRGQSPQNETFSDWREALAEAQSLNSEVAGTDATALDLAGPFFVAACVIRDHFSELQPAELAWCQTVLTEEVLRKDADKTRETRISKSFFEGSRPAAFVLPIFLRQIENDENRRQVEECLAVAVTHSSEEVRDCVAEGIRVWLWEIDPGLAKACVGGLIELAAAENRIRTSHRRDLDYSDEVIEHEVEDETGEIRRRIISRQTLDVFESLQIDLEMYDWPELLDALSMEKFDTEDADLKRFFGASLGALLREAEAGEAWKSTRHVSHKFQRAFAPLFARFALARTPEETDILAALLIANIEKCPRFLAVLLENLPGEEDRVRSGAPFWGIWRKAADHIFKHPLLRKGLRHRWRYSEMHKLVRIILFAELQWKDGVEEWDPVTSTKDFFESAASTIGDTPAGFGALTSLLNAVGQVFLPDAIMWLAQSIESAKETDPIADPDADFELEVLLRTVCYNFGTVVRQRPELHRSVLTLLDKLVEHGSHTAFRLRDYMLAPLPAEG